MGHYNYVKSPPICECGNAMIESFASPSRLGIFVCTSCFERETGCKNLTEYANKNRVSQGGNYIIKEKR